jgi:2-keto-4-pentenoate hydratase/2-oxohepta-3-ene-1,7-dioic acid hydratase in catechol pathway
MKIARGITTSGKTVYAKVIHDHDKILFHRLEYSLPFSFSETSEPVEFERLLSPIEPRAILCVGMNYIEHAAALGVERPKYPVIVPKGINAVIGPEAKINLPTQLPCEKVDYEGELAVVIGRDAKNVPVEKALEYVFGYTCANDVSARDWQFEKGGGQWSRGKSFDTFAPLGPWLVTTHDIPDPSNLKIKTLVNGDCRQESSTDRMIFGVAELVAFLSASSTVLAGTVLLTGTPAGVGMKRNPPTWLRKGDSISIEIEKIGTLQNEVSEEVLF